VYVNSRSLNKEQGDNKSAMPSQWNDKKLQMGKLWHSLTSPEKMIFCKIINEKKNFAYIDIIKL